MRINEYQELAMVTRNKDLDYNNILANVGLGLTGESGEVADIIKKHLCQNHILDIDNLTEELGDVCWYIALGCEVLNIKMEDVLQRNIDKLKKRYPDGFNKDRSINRIE